MNFTKRVWAIDLLRAFAALIVLNSHASIFTRSEAFGDISGLISHFIIQPLWNLTGVHPGVIIFITLSGFLIHHTNKNLPISFFSRQYWYHYFLKRTIRIFPVLTFAILMGSLVCYFSGLSVSVVSIIQSFFSPFFANNAAIPGNEILNTVITEYWIYLLVYPAFILLGKKNWLWYVSLLIYLLNYSRGFFTETSAAYKTWLGINFFSFQLFWITGAFFCDRSEQLSKWYAGNKKAGILIHAFFILFIILGNNIFFKGKYIISNILFSVLVSFYVVWFQNIKGYLNTVVHFFSNRVFTIYAIHFPLLLMYKQLPVSLNGWLSDLLLFAGIFLSIELVYQLIEKPSHQWARYIGNNKATGAVN